MLSQIPATLPEVQTLLGGFRADISTQNAKAQRAAEDRTPIISAQVDDVIQSYSRWTSPRFFFWPFAISSSPHRLLCGPPRLCGLCVSRLRNRYRLFAAGQIAVANSRSAV